MRVLKTLEKIFPKGKRSGKAGWVKEETMTSVNEFDND
jgi:hypothetical protein